MSRLYTRTGDHGTTGLIGGERRSKTDLRIHCIGEVDELNAWLGLLRSASLNAELAAMVEAAQTELFELGAELAAPGAEPRLTTEQVATVERWIDRLDDDLPPLRQFILPGGSTAAAHAHIARAVCRRAERSLTALREQTSTAELGMAGCQYLNRLSDWLFVVGRTLARSEGEELPWLPRP